jgi:hypothetical protein
MVTGKNSGKKDEAEFCDRVRAKRRGLREEKGEKEIKGRDTLFQLLFSLLLFLAQFSIL